MFPYRVKYIESESDIKDYSFFYNKHQQCQNTFETLETNENIEFFKFLFCNMYNLYNSYVVFFVNFVLLGFMDLYIYIYILLFFFYTCRPLTRVGLLHV